MTRQSWSQGGGRYERNDDDGQPGRRSRRAHLAYRGRRRSAEARRARGAGVLRYPPPGTVAEDQPGIAHIHVKRRVGAKVRAQTNELKQLEARRLPREKMTRDEI
eukprot:scaffold23378_cov103-Isochrysis_galbana.AAC.3